MMNDIAAPLLARIAALAAGLRRPARRPVAAAAASRAAPVERLSVESQWARVTGVVSSAVATVHSVRNLQTAAGQQIDSAAYALQGLMAELSSVMRLPAMPQAETNIHRLEPQTAPAMRHELAA